VEDFALLNESSRAQVLALTVEARAASNPPALSPAFGTGSNTISHRINPAQLALASRLATPVPQPPRKPGDKAPPPAPPVHYTSASSLRPQCDLPYIALKPASINGSRPCACGPNGAEKRKPHQPLILENSI